MATTICSSLLLPGSFPTDWKTQTLGKQPGKRAASLDLTPGPRASPWETLPGRPATSFPQGRVSLRENYPCPARPAEAPAHKGSISPGCPRPLPSPFSFLALSPPSCICRSLSAGGSRRPRGRGCCPPRALLPPGSARLPQAGRMGPPRPGSHPSMGQPPGDNGDMRGTLST